MIDWSATAPAWSRFLQGHGFRFSIGDNLLLDRLAQRLHAEGVPILDAKGAARWFGPMFCRNADEQARLPSLLQGWEQLQEPAPAEALPPTLAPVAAANAEFERVRRRPWRMATVAALGLAALFVLASLLLHAPAQPVTPDPLLASPSHYASVAVAPFFETTNRVLAPFVASALCMGVILFLNLRRRQRAALLRGLVTRDARQAALSISTPRLDLFRPGALQPTMGELRRHRMVEADWIDGEASVCATVAKAGFVQLVQGRRPETPEHLLLVDMAGSDDVLGVLADLVADRLNSGSVTVERYDFRGDPRRLQIKDPHRFPRGDGPSTTLEALRAEHPDARVFVLSDAGGFGLPGSDRLRGWVDDLRAWNEVALLTPLSPSQWGVRERALLQRGFLLVHAVPDGLVTLARLLRADLAVVRAMPGRGPPLGLDARLASNPYKWLGDTSPSPPQVAAMMADLEAALDASGMLYLSALAVFPLLHPKLVVAVGEVLSAADGQRLLSEATLAQLCRVPWLRQGRIPDWLRLALVRRLQGRPEEETRVLAAWSQLLQPPDAADPATALTLNVARTVPAGLPGLVAGVFGAKAGPCREAILLSFLRQEKLPELAIELPGRLEEVLRAPSHWLEGGLAGVVLVMAAVALAFGGTVGDAVRNAVITFLNAISDPALSQLVKAVEEALLGPAAALMSLAGLALCYVPDRWQRLTPYFCGGGFVLMLLAWWLSTRSDVPQAGFHATAGSTVLAGWLVLFSFFEYREASRWAPLLVVFGISVFTKTTGTISLSPLLIPLVAWLASRYRWPDLRNMLLLAAPGMTLSLDLGAGFMTAEQAGDLFALGIMARVVADPVYRVRCSVARDFGWREASVLLLPLAVSLSVSLGGVRLFWSPAWVLFGCCGLIGWSAISLRFVLPAIVLSGLAFATASIFTLGAHELSFLRVEHLFQNFWGLPTALLFMASGRIVQRAVLLDLGRTWTAATLNIAALILGFMIPLIMVQWPHPLLMSRSDGSVLLLPEAAVAVAAALTLTLGNDTALRRVCAGGLLAFFLMMLAHVFLPSQAFDYFHPLIQVNRFGLLVRNVTHSSETLLMFSSALLVAIVIRRSQRTTAAVLSAPAPMQPVVAA